MAAPAPSMADLDPLAALLAADPMLAAQLAQLAPGEAPSGGPSRLAALLAANPALRALIAPAPGEALGGDGSNPDDAKVRAAIAYSVIELSAGLMQKFLSDLPILYVGAPEV